MNGISIIITSFNLGLYLRECIESALSQDSASDEIIVVDDGSSDDTPEIIRGYGERIRSIRQDNGGVVAARNAGAAMATGKFLLFLDGDDRLRSDALRKLSEPLLPDETLAVSYSDGIFFGKFDGRLHARALAGFALKQEYASNFILAPSLIRKSSFDACGGFDPAFNRLALEDWDLWLRMMRAGFGFHYVPEPLVECRVREDGRSHGPDFRKRHSEAYRLLREKNPGTVALPSVRLLRLLGKAAVVMRGVPNPYVIRS